MNRPYSPDTLFDLSLYAHARLFRDIIYPWEALSFLEEYLRETVTGNQRGSISSKAFIQDEETVDIGFGTIVEPGAYIKGPCIIGNHCVIRHGAYIRGNVITGNRCIIGHATEVKNSIFLDQAQAAHFNYVGDSVIGNRVNLGAGVKLANLLFNRKKIYIELFGTETGTNRRKLGALIGDDVQIGCNTVTAPGTIVAKRSRLFPMLHVGGYISEDQTVKINTQPYRMKNYAFSQS